MRRLGASLGLLGVDRIYPAMPWWQLGFVTEAWDASIASTVTASGGFASSWAPIKGTHSLLQATGDSQPGYANGELTLDGIDDFMKSDAFTLNQPFTLFLALKQITWASGDTFIDGNGTGSRTAVGQKSGGASPQISMFAGSEVATNGDLTIGAYGIVTAIFNGASSSLRVNLGTATTGNASTQNAGALTLGCAFTDVALAFANCAFKGVGYGTGALTAAQCEQVVRSMAAQYGIAV